jgi:hypothetical protein
MCPLFLITTSYVRIHSNDVMLPELRNAKLDIGALAKLSVAHQTCGTVTMIPNHMGTFAI